MSQIVVIQTKRFQTDLLQVLLPWQSAGLTIALQDAWQPWDPRHVTLKRPSLVRLLWHRLHTRLGYRRGLSGGFGELMPRNSG